MRITIILNNIFKYTEIRLIKKMSEKFPSPFRNNPHPLAEESARHLMSELSQMQELLKPGKGFRVSVLVVKGSTGYLSGSSVYPDEGRLSHPFLRTGDCPLVSLLKYASENRLTPLASAEFWWGDSPSDEVRHHGIFYPVQGKCREETEKVLSSLNAESPPVFGKAVSIPDSEPKTVYEDRHLLIVNKPYGLLSVPGKETEDSVETRIRARYPDAKDIMLLHRLDLSTSGLLLIAKNRYIHRDLQRLFLNRSIEKRYTALVHGCLPESPAEGVISLPLRHDLNDRPRQVVCYKEGKEAVTGWERIGCEGDFTRVKFFPRTGRSHQIRMHASHKDGLNAPIKGDELYGFNDSGRLCLNAEKLSFVHPVTGYRIETESPVPF